MKKLFIIICSIIVVALLAIWIGYSTNDKAYVGNYVKDLGYNFDETGIMYKKIVTNNTLDNFYDDMRNKKDANYLEYYFNLDTYSFIELYMFYTEDVTGVYNINSDLANKVISYNYELTKDDSSVMLEGKFDQENGTFSCDIASIKKMPEIYVKSYCDDALDYGREFIKEQNKLLLDSKFQKILSKKNN